MDGLFKCNNMLEALHIATECTSKMNGGQIVDLIKDKLRSGVRQSCFTMESICALMEVLTQRSGRVDDMKPVYDYLHGIGESAVVYLSVCLVLMAQLAFEKEHDIPKASSILSSVNPLQLEKSPSVFLVRCYLLKSSTTDGSDLTQKARLLDKGLEHFKASKHGMSANQRNRLMFKLLYQRCKVFLNGDRLVDCLNESLRILKLYSSYPEYFSTSQQFLDNLHSLVHLFLCIPYCLAKVRALQEFGRLICPCSKGGDSGELHIWLKDAMKPEIMRDVICSMALSKVIRMDSADLDRVLHCQYPEQKQYLQIRKNLLVSNIVVMSKNFKSVKISTMCELMGMEGEEAAVEELLVDMILNVIVRAQIDDATGAVRFGSSGKSVNWKVKAAKDLVEVDNVYRDVK